MSVIPTAPTTRERLGRNGLLLRGAVGGLVAGAVFIGVTMWFASSQGQPAEAPLRLISTIVLGDNALPNGETNVAVGMVVHVILSIVFGLVFAALVAPLRSDGWIACAGLIYGVLLYVVNFQILSRVFFTSFQMANQPFELFAHMVFGAVLVLFLPNYARSRG